MPAPRPARLRFSAKTKAEQTHTNLSAIRTDGDDTLWVAGDESTSIERLTRQSDTRGLTYADEVSFRLADLVTLPSGKDSQEADLEGLARDGDYLWAVGSHSLKRSRVKDHHEGAKAFKRLGKVQAEANRHVLLRIPVVDVDGVPTLQRRADIDGSTEPAAVLGGKSDSLTDLLEDDRHLAPFLSVPSKDNGFDVEGIAAFGDRVFIGLRGPVLRGWAIVLEISVTASSKHPSRLEAQRFDDGARYRKHILDLGGLGVRDLCKDGDDLLVLAGPTMDLDGPVRVFRWHDVPAIDEPQVVRDEQLTPELDLPYGEGEDHAEGIALLGSEDAPELLVVYDSPGEHRKNPRVGMLADRFALDRRRSSDH